MQFKIEPWPNQLAALERFKQLGGRMLNQEPMGEGKTGAACLILRHLSQEHGSCIPAIIVCPCSVTHHWKNTIAAHCFDSISTRTQILDGSERNRMKQLEAQGKRVFITNYESTRMKALWPMILNCGFVLLIVDESQKVKDPVSLQGKSVIKLADRTPCVLSQTGTPVLNSPKDIWAQLRLLDKNEEFVDRNNYAWVKQNFYNANASKPWIKWPAWEIRPEKKEELGKVLADHSYLSSEETRSKRPPLVKSQATVELTPALARMYGELESDFLTQVDADNYIVTDLAITKLLRLQELCNGVVKLKDETRILDTEKLSALEDLLGGIGREKAVIWCNFRTPISAIETLLKAMRLNYVLYTGGQDQHTKECNLINFKSNPAVRVCIATQAAGGVGVDGFQVAPYAFYYSRGFNLEHDIQSEKRTHRPGDAGHARCARVDIITRGTVEERIDYALANKMSLAEFFRSFSQSRQRAA